MKNKPDIITFFPTTVLKVSLPNSVASVVSFLDNQLHTIPNPDPKMAQQENGKNYGEISKDTYILENKECKDLRDNILFYSTYYAEEILGYYSQEWKFSQSWISLKYPNQTHHSHTHGNSIISGVFYYGSNYHISESYNITFHKHHTPPAGFNTLSVPSDENKINYYNTTNYNINPQPGDLLIFPSHLMHSVPENQSNKIRRSLAFNVVPKKGFGSEHTLTELKFN